MQKLTLHLLCDNFDSNYSQLLDKAKKSTNDYSKIALSVFKNIQDNKSSQSSSYD